MCILSLKSVLRGPKTSDNRAGPRGKGFCGATVVSPGSRLYRLPKAIRGLLAATIAGAIGWGCCSFSQFVGSSDETDDTEFEPLSSAPTSFTLSLENHQHFSRRVNYTMRGKDGRTVSGLYEESSRAVSPGRASDEEPLAYLDTKWKSSLGRDLADAQFEFASSSRRPYDGTEFGNQNSSSLFWFDLQHADQQFSYGLDYFSIGEEFAEPGNSKSNPKADRQGTQLWGQWSLGTLGIKPFLSRSHDNLEEDPDRSRLTDTQVGLSLNQSLLSWPGLGYSVSYLIGTRRSSLEPESYKPYSGPISTATLSVNYSANEWNASLNSSHADSGNTANGNANQNTTVSHYLSGSYYPNSTINFTGDFGHVMEEHNSFDARTSTIDASLSLSYKPPIGRFDRHIYMVYSAQKNLKWQLNTRYFSAGAGQRWYLRRKPSTISVLSFDINYDRYLDDIYSEASTADLTFWLKFSHEFGARPLLVPNLGYLVSKRSLPQPAIPKEVDESQIAEEGSSETTGTTRPISDNTKYKKSSVPEWEAHDEAIIGPANIHSVAVLLPKIRP
jgi:hypothetical protein